MTATRTLYDPLAQTGGWVIAAELEELPQRDHHGRVFLTARVPRIERQFSSPMHQPEGLSVRMGNWRQELQAFLSGLLPTARLSEETSMDSERAALRGAVIRAIEEGFAGALRVDAEGEVYGYLARPDRIRNTIDVDALIADYEAWFAAAGIDASLGDDATYLADQLRWAHADLSENCYSDYLLRLGDSSFGGDRVLAAVVEGIVHGDEPAKSCAFLLQRELVGDKRLWEASR